MRSRRVSIASLSNDGAKCLDDNQLAVQLSIFFSTWSQWTPLLRFDLQLKSSLGYAAHSPNVFRVLSFSRAFVPQNDVLVLNWHLRTSHVTRWDVGSAPWLTTDGAFNCGKLENGSDKVFAARASSWTCDGGYSSPKKVHRISELQHGAENRFWGNNPITSSAWCDTVHGLDRVAHREAFCIRQCWLMSD